MCECTLMVMCEYSSESGCIRSMVVIYRSVVPSAIWCCGNVEYNNFLHEERCRFASLHEHMRCKYYNIEMHVHCLDVWNNTWQACHTCKVYPLFLFSLENPPPCFTHILNVNFLDILLKILTFVLVLEFHNNLPDLSCWYFHSMHFSY